ncbi:hypothetical protein [Psychrobacter pygoscelis]|uniref:hypothetical protein n=1 Tax=Psychrobacter pygoscelis TaxID=2488563 RepID=UPI00103E3304|nr:hypothetical protein [Psychrobacter pygoscelis]
MKKQLFGMPLHYSLIAFAVVFFGLMIYLNNSTMSPEGLAEMEARQAQRVQDELDAAKANRLKPEVMSADCQTRLQKTLKNPKSLDMTYSPDNVRNNGDEIVVSFDYRAENGFGGMTGGHATCAYTLNGYHKSSNFI